MSLNCHQLCLALCSVTNIRAECYLLTEHCLLIICRYVVMVRVAPEDNALAVTEFLSFYKENNSGMGVKRMHMEKGPGGYQPLPHARCYLN